MPLPPLTLRSDKGSPLTSAEMDANLQTIRDFLNSLEDRVNVSLKANGQLLDNAVTLTSIPDGLITLAKLANEVLPSGIVIPWASGASVPTGWLECNGNAISRTTYAALYTILSTSYGPGDGTTTFNLPNFQGRTVIGAGTGPSNYLATGNAALTARSLGQVTGEETHVLVLSETPVHTHTYTKAPFQAAKNSGGDTANAGPSEVGYPTSSVGGDGAHNNMQPSFVARWIIKT